jgi:RNA polymerase sigma-70 factor, ECF subfamily
VALDTSVSLLLRLKGGTDPAAWDRFVELYTPMMYRWVLQLGAQSADASDVVQDVLIRLIKTLPRFDYDRGRSFRAWLRTVVTNSWRERWRKSVPMLLSESALIGLAGEDEHGRWNDAEDQAELCRRALELIRPEFAATTWDAFIKTVMEGQPVAETAQTLGLTANAVYLARSRILARLRQEIAGLWE